MNSPFLYIGYCGENMRIYYYILSLCALLVPHQVSAQSVALSPPGLSSVPKGATAANPYWQHLVISLTRNPSAGNIITISLPVGITIADTDGDGDWTDEVALDDSSSTGTGYNSTNGTSQSQIVLHSETGGVSGKLHVHYPIITSTSSVLSSTAYGQIYFSNTNELAIPAGSLVLTLVEPRNLNLATFSQLFIESAADTTTNVQGDAYPDTAAAAFALVLPDLVSDVRGNLLSNALTAAGVPFADGSDSNDVQYAFWFSLRDTLAQVDTSVATLALERTTLQTAQVEEKSLVSLAFDVSSLLDTTYYLYMTSNLTGNFPLMRSRGILVQHKPVVLSVGDFKSNDADFLDSGFLLDFDRGQASLVDSAKSSVALTFNVVDYDDSASVRLFYAIADTLDTTFVTTTGTVPSRVLSGLTNATFVDSTASLREGKDSAFNWQIAVNDTNFVTRGDYYIYAVITDGTDLGIKRSSHTYNVRHSPFLAFDSRRDQNLNTGGTDPDRYYAITWNRDSGKEGDRALIDSASIALYYSASDSIGIPGGKTALVAAAADSTQDTHLIVSGLQEQPDGRGDNQYIWDLWTYKNPDDQQTPKQAVPYYLYALVETDSTNRVVRWDDEMGQARQLNFTHDPYLRPLAPLKTVAAEGRKSFRVAWQAEDVDDSAGVWVLLTTVAAADSLGARSTYAAVVGDSIVDWVANSTDGSLAQGTALNEDLISEHSVRSALLINDLTGAASPIVDGQYAVYLIIDTQATNPPADASLAVRVPGVVQISGLPASGAAGLVSPAIEVLPADLTLEVQGDTTLLELRPHSNGEAVDLLAFFARVDTAFFSVVDQDTASGVQPFKLDSSLAGIALRDTLLVGADSLSAGKWLLDLIYFEQGDMSQLDGSFALATVQLVSREAVGSTTLDIDHFGNRKSAFYRDGEEVALIPPETAVRAEILPRGTISGKVRLQGRTDFTNMMTLLLRDRNDFLPITDSLFSAANDADTTIAGIQDSIASDGSFSLSKVPTGDYQLAVHFDGFLDGQFPAVSVNLGDTLTGVDPTFLADGVSNAGFLLGGDVTGYVDASGAQIPDNEIDQLDVDFVVSFFGQSINATHSGRLADIDGDSLVWVADLNIIAANFNIDGVEPVYKIVAGGEAMGDWRIEQRDEGGNLEVQVWADDMAGARAYGYRLRYDSAELRLRSARQGEAFDRRPAVFAEHREAGAIAIGAALNGGQVGVEGPNSLGIFVFERLNAVGSEAAIEIRDAQWVDAGHRVRVPTGQAALPTVFALLPNFPNPFNPETTLRFQLPKRGAVELAIYDAAGQRVRALLGGELAAGAYTAVWDGRDQAGHEVASGTYFARLRAGSRMQVRKMTLLR